MKKFSLKKVTAAVSTAAMIASMGTMAFADETSALALTIGEPVAGDNGVYTYTISYAGDVTNENGVSMLAYGVKGADETAGVTGSIDENTQYGEGMRILGVEQNSKDAVKEFKLVLTTNADGTNGYYVQAGKPVVVAVNGNGKVGYGYIKTYATANSIADILGDKVTNGKLDLEASEAANGADDTVKTAAKDKVVTYLESFFGNGNVTVSEDSLNVTRDSGVSVSYTATVKAGKYEVDSTNYNVASDLTVQGTVTVPYTVLDATELTNSGVTMTESELDGATGDAAKAKVKQLLAAKTDVKVTLKNGDVTDEVTLNFAENGNATVGDITAGPTTAENEKDTVYTVPVTVKAGITGSKGIVKVGNNYETVNINVTVTAKTVISGFAGTFPNAHTVTDKAKWTKDEVKKAVEALYKDIAITLCDNEGQTIGEDVFVDGKALTTSDFVIEAIVPEFESTATSVNVTVNVTGVNSDSTNTDLKDNYTVGTVKLSDVTVTFKSYTLGDLNGDGKITGADVGEMNAYIATKAANEPDYKFYDKNNGSEIPVEAADLNGDGKITGADVGEMNAYIATKAANEPDYVFPVEKK